MFRSHPKNGEGGRPVTYFLLLLLAHGVADFILQTDAVSAAKCKNQWQGYVRHGLAVFLCTLGALHFYGWLSALKGAALVSIAHLALDVLKNLGRSAGARLLGKPSRPGVFGLLLDQVLHIFILLWTWHLLDRPVDTSVTGFYAAVLTPVQPFLPSGMEQAVLVLAICVLTAFGGAVLVRLSLDKLFPDGEGLRGATAAGKYIGILERLLIIILAATDTVSAIGFVFTAKSIARFNEISENRAFAEYYLVGTLISFFLALVAGMALGQYLNAV